MDGIHDLGDREGFGQIEHETDRETFHARWESRVFAMAQMGFAIGAFRNVDHFRHAIERINPIAYLEDGYYGRWLGGLETALVEAELLPAEGVSTRAARPVPQPEFPAHETRAPTAGRELPSAAAFPVGTRVRAAPHGKPGHTRLPAYARGRVGTVVAQHGGWVFPDTNAHGAGEQPQHLYTVRFDGDELWGENSDPDLEVCIDLFESYLRRV